MAEFRTPVITNTGLNIINKALSGEVIEFSSVKTGVGNYTGSEDLTDATDLLNYKNSYSISAVSVEGNTLKINTVINNEGVNVGYHINEVGIYVTVGKQEKLLAIVTAANPDFLAERTSSPVTIVTEFYLTIDRASSLAFTYTVPEGVYVDVRAFETGIRNLENKIKNNINSVIEVWVRVGGFTQTAPYTLRIDVPGMKSTDTPVISHTLLNGVTDPGVIKRAWKAYSCIDRIDTFDGYMLVTCYRKRPAQDILLNIKGVGI